MRANTVLAAVLLTCSASARQGAAQAPFDGPPGAIRMDSLTLVGLLQAANHGSAEAKYELGLRYESGRGGARVDSERALQWFEEAAMAGLAPAMTKAALSMCVRRVQLMCQRLRSGTARRMGKGRSGNTSAGEDGMPGTRHAEGCTEVCGSAG